MTKFNNLRTGVIAVSVAALLIASPAAAQLDGAAVSCRAAIAKEYQKLMKTATKIIAGCHKSRNKGDASLAAVDCNELTTNAAQVDPKGKYAKTAGKSVASINAACPGSLDSTLTSANVGGEGEELYVSCPADSCTGVSGLLDSMGEVASCMPCAASTTADAAAAATLGMPTLPLSTGDQKCVASIAKGYGKYLLTGLKDQVSCQGTADSIGQNDATLCENSDSKLKVASALTKAGEGMTTACASSAANVANLGGCSVIDLASLEACTPIPWSDNRISGFNQIYKLDATTCPSTIRTTIRGGCGVNGTDPGTCSSGFESGSVLSVGWKGLGHGLDITDNYTIAGDVTCAGTEKGSCGVCIVDGTSIDNPQYQDFTRCVDAPWVACSGAALSDPLCATNCVGGSNPGASCIGDPSACLGGGTCTQFPGACSYYLGPPLAISAGGTPTCSISRFATDVTGTVQPDSGEADLFLDLSTRVYLGGSQTRPCPICINDSIVQDGVRNGTCLSDTGTSPREGEACDVQGFDLTFAATDAQNPTRGMSLDCPPAPGANISGSGLVIQLPLTTGTSTKDAVDPCESPNALKDCFCGVCSVGFTPCDSDADCDAGVCEAGQNASEGVSRKPNNCTDGTCEDAGNTDRGYCDGDIDKFCSGPVFANGKGIITCNMDADCDTFISGSVNPEEWTCPNNICGTCTVEQFRSCFLDPYTVEGTPDTVNPTMAGTFCLPPSSNGSVNGATGAPGPGSVQTDTIVTLRY